MRPPDGRDMTQRPQHTQKSGAHMPAVYPTAATASRDPVDYYANTKMYNNNRRRRRRNDSAVYRLSAASFCCCSIACGGT